MSIALALEKDGELIVASDTLTSFGHTKVPPALHAAQKIRRVGGSYLAATGWGLYENILDDVLARRGSVRLGTRERIFAFFLRLWNYLHKKYSFVNDPGASKAWPCRGYDQVTVTVRGTGDPEQAASRYAQAVRAAGTGREVAPEEFVLAMAGRPHAEDGAWVVTGLVRAGSIATRARAKEAILRNVAEVVQEGVTPEVRYEDLVLPDMVNDTALVRSTLGAIRAAVGAEGLVEVNQVTPYFSEDFAWFQQRIPGAMYWLGVSNSALGTVGMPHTPGYVADEGAIAVGAKAMAAVLLDYLAAH